MREKVGKCQFSCFVKVSNENNLGFLLSIPIPLTFVCHSLFWHGGMVAKCEVPTPKVFCFLFWGRISRWPGAHQIGLVWLATEAQSTYFCLPSGGIPSVFHYTCFLKWVWGIKQIIRFARQTSYQFSFFSQSLVGRNLYLRFSVLFSASLWIVSLVFHDNSN